MKNKNPIVSVIVPVYNGALYIQDSVESALASTYPHFEIILVNDGSSDNSAAICKQLAKKHTQIRFFSFPKNKGLSNVLNFAIEKAQGTYIARLNQDDFIMPDRFARQVQFLEDHQDHVAVGTAIELFTNNQKVIDTISFPLSNEDIKKQWLTLSPFSDPAVMYTKAAFLKTKGYEQRFWPVDDVHMWYKLGKIGKLANLPLSLTRVRWHSDAGSVRSHKIQMRKLFELHIWASEKVGEASLFTWLFWINQYLAGFLFPPAFNWFIYRKLRKLKTVSFSFPHFTPS